MLARVLSAAVNGIEAFPVEVEVNCGWGDTVIVIVGLPDAPASNPASANLAPVL
jgi:magnesium chelatase family protein